MIAALPMYDHPGVRADTDALWAAIRDRLRAKDIAAPESLSRSADLAAQWRSSELLLGQTCGLPFRTWLHESVTLLGAFDYGLPDTPPGYYRSVFVAREADPRGDLAEFAGALLAYNEAGSHSGWATAVETGVPFRIGPATGAHVESVRAIGEGRAEIAAIDAISWRLILAHTELARGLKIVGRSRPAPGQALITAFADHAAALREAIAAGIADLDPSRRAALGLRGFVRISPAAYLAVPNPPSPEAFATRSG